MCTRGFVGATGGSPERELGVDAALHIGANTRYNIRFANLNRQKGAVNG